MSEETNLDHELEKRKEKFISFMKKRELWVIGILIIVLILGAYIRVQPMLDHNGEPGLWDITTNSWTLGPDLDPFLFLRTAQTILKNGSVPSIDTMRYVPLGADTSVETKLLPYMIVWTYDFLNAFSPVTIEYAADILPVIMFALTIIAFFLFVREIFIKKHKKIEANIIALISSLFLTVIPVFLSRTIAGVPEKESTGFFFMFLAFYFFLKAWNNEGMKKPIIFSVLAGLSTALMGFIWGGMVYIFVGIGVATLLAFLLGKVKKKETLIYSLWLISSLIILQLFSNKYNILGMFRSTDYILAFITFFIMIIHYFLWETKLKEKISFLKKFHLPENITSIIISLVLGIVLITIAFGPGFILSEINHFINTFVNPTTGRWGVTVAENKQPYFTEWGSSFGPFIKNIPITFWLFITGSIVLFKQMTGHLKKKDSWALTGLYALFLMGLIFSRYAPHPNILDGEGFISKFFYFGSAFLFLGYLVYDYVKYYREKENSFERIDFSFLFLFALFVLTLFTARSAVRLIMVLAPFAVIYVGYLIVFSTEKFRKTKDETAKILMGLAVIIIILSSLFAFVSFYQSIKSQSYSYVPSMYNQQWQKAMEWVRDNTPADAVFAHWWDYGYWVQTIGERATVLDGGNYFTYWNYLMGRLVLTGDNQHDALEFLYAHNASYLLIDSSDIGKYTAFSSIGSDINYDRYSWIATFLQDQTQTQETKNQTIYVYTGGIALDEDLIINESGKQVLLPAKTAGVGLIIVPVSSDNGTGNFEQPYIIAVYQGIQHKINLRYLASSDGFIDFGSGIEACAFIFPSLSVQNNGVSGNPIGAVMYLSPRLMRGFLVQKYILNDPFNNFPNFQIAHTEQNLLIDSLNSQGMNLPDFVYYQGIQGPIKIWNITYNGDETVNPAYLDTDYTKYINWRL
jgi:asparagine N-glycosylation enzyme membrane subunit Stt3